MGEEENVAKIPGSIATRHGYANGKTENPSNEDVWYNNAGHAETVKIVFDDKIVSLEILLKLFFKIIDPTLKNQQGNDFGSQYRTGIFYNKDQEKEVLPIIEKVFLEVAKKYEQQIVTEVEPLINFYVAEEYHQQYLEKNPNGYCHIDITNAKKAFQEALDETKKLS